MMLAEVCSHQNLVGYVLVFAYFVNLMIEYYLGKTERTRSNSIAEFILTGVGNFLRFILRRRIP